MKKTNIETFPFIEFDLAQPDATANEVDDHRATVKGNKGKQNTLKIIRDKAYT